MTARSSSTPAPPTARTSSSASRSRSRRCSRCRTSRSSGSRSTATSKSLGSATFAIFDVATAQKLFDREGEFDAISVAGKEGTTPAQLVSDIQPILPADAQVKTGVEEAQESQDEIGEFTTFIRYFLLAFAGIALFVGSFVIFNTLSITVAQRTREFATLRTLGASRRQVLRSVLLEAFVIGLLASLIGLALGIALAKGLDALFRALGLGLPAADTVYAPRTVIVSLLVGTIITVVAGLFPAIRATRVPPIAAVREGAELPKGRWHRFTPYVAIVLIALALFLLGYSMFADDVGTAQRLLSIAGGVLLLFVGVAMISSKLVRPLAAVVGLPARWIGGAAGRARAAQRGPKSGSHRRDGRGADDRRRARRLRRDVRERDEGIEPRCDRGSDHGELHHHVAGRLHAVRRCRRRRGRRTRRRPRRSRTSARRSPRSRVTAAT